MNLLKDTNVVEHNGVQFWNVTKAGEKTVNQLPFEYAQHVAAFNLHLDNPFAFAESPACGPSRTTYNQPVIHCQSHHEPVFKDTVKFKMDQCQSQCL